MAFWNSSTMQDDKKKERAQRICSFVLSIIILVVFFVFFGDTVKAPVSIQMDETALTLTGNTEDTVHITYEDVVSIALVDSVDFGEKVDGNENKRGCSGIWKNDQWGEYHRFTTAKLEEYLVFTTSDSTVVVFNYETEEVTENLYLTFYTMLTDAGLADQIAFSSCLDAE